MEHVKTLKADTHEEIAEKVEKFLRNNDLSYNNCVITYSTAATTDLFAFLFAVNKTFHYAMIIYKKEEKKE